METHEYKAVAMSGFVPTLSQRQQILDTAQDLIPSSLFKMKKCQRRVSNALDHNRTRCRWCRKSYRSSGAYSNHIQANHPQHIQTLYTLAALPQAPTLEKLHPDPPLANNADLYPPQTNNLEPYLQYVDSDHEVLEEVNDNDDLDNLKPLPMMTAPAPTILRVPMKYFPLI